MKTEGWKAQDIYLERCFLIYCFPLGGKIFVLAVSPPAPAATLTEM